MSRCNWIFHGYMISFHLNDIREWIGDHAMQKILYHGTALEVITWDGSNLPSEITDRQLEEIEKAVTGV